LFTLAPAREAAYAQFSTPWDPDFARQPARNVPPSAEEPGAATAAPAPEGPAAEAAAAPVVIIPGTGPFLLLDRPDPAHILEPLGPEASPAVAVSTQPPHELLEFAVGLKPFSYSTERLALARTHLEQGLAPSEPSPFLGQEAEELAISTTQSILPPPPELEMPAQQMSLSITGRKIIGFNYSEKRYLHSQALTGNPQTTDVWNITQQMQLRMQGKVGPKITVNVDYDDTQVNHQDISIVYQGDPNETVQNVSFGDIDLSLPPTEFVSYNKQLFGIRADVKYQGFKATAIASRTKGTTKFKEFIGNTQFVNANLLDTGYTRRQYYDLTFATLLSTKSAQVVLPIRTGSELVWLTQQNNVAPNVNQSSFTAFDFGVGTATVSSNLWTRLAPGTDYTMDYVNGIITFRNVTQPQYAVAVDFLDNTGTYLSQRFAKNFPGLVSPNPAGLTPSGQQFPILIKTPSDLPIEAVTACTTCTAELGYDRELKTVYSLGQPQIVADNGQGNFILKVVNQANVNVDVGSTLNPVEEYPQTIQVNFANGTFRLLEPFAVAGDSAVPDPGIYAPTPISQRNINVQYYYRLKTFNLEPSLVAQSESVVLDGVKLNRNVDYFIDYTSGFITFFNPDRIGPNSRVDINYEVSPLGGISNTSLLGGRVSYDFTKNISLGSTLLYQAGAKDPTTPNISDVASSLMVYDFDLKLKDIQLLPKLKGSFAGEYAQSIADTNLNGNAFVDNMQGIQQETTAPLTWQSWQMASNPSYPGSVPADPGGDGWAIAQGSTVFHWSWSTEGDKILSVTPNAQAGPNDTENVLDLSYDFSNPASTQEISIVYPFSISGSDFSQSTILEVTMLGDNSNNLVNFRLGGIDESADGSGILRTEDLIGNGILEPGEDVGWCYERPSFPGQVVPCEARYGAGNGLLDTDNLSKTGHLQGDDGNGGDYGYMCAPTQIGGTGCANSGNNGQLFSLASGTHTAIDFGTGAAGPSAGWQTFQIPLNISSANLTSWQAIKDIRISVRRGAGGVAAGTLKFAHIGVLGTTWQPGQAGDPATGQGPVAAESLVDVPVNSVNNTNYVPIYNAGGDASNVYDELFGSVANQQSQSGTSNIVEQSLQMAFSSMTLSTVAGSTTTVYTKRAFTKAIDISQHKQFNFLIYGNPPGTGSNNFTDHQFFLRVGNDANFWEVQVPLTTQFSRGWHKITVNQTSSIGNGVEDTWTSGTAGVTVISSGTPSLQQVAELVAGVRKIAGTPGIPTGGALWLDEIYLDHAVTRVGAAHSISADFDWTNWATFGFKDRSTDLNFQTPTSVVSNQDNRLDSAYFNLRRIAFFPMTFNVSRTITDTPNTGLTGTLSNLVSNLQNGLVTAWNGTATGNFSRGAWPRLSLSYKRLYTEYDSLDRIDDSNDYSVALQYGVPLKSRLAPKTVDLNYDNTTSLTNYSTLALLNETVPGNSYANTRDLSQTYGARLTFIPWTGSSFNPKYTLTKVMERESDFYSGPIIGQEMDRQYPKTLNETAGFDANFKILKWLAPQVNYQASIIDNTVLNVSTVITNTTYYFDIGAIKTVNRSANGSVTLPINVADILPKSALLRSLNIVNGYQLQDGDVWNYVESGYQDSMALWVRTPLRPHNPAAQLASQTLRDTFNSTQRWSPFSAYNPPGRWAALKTLSISNNFVYSIQRSDVTGTLSKIISTTLPDLVASISQVEVLLRTQRWMTNTQINLRYSAHRIDTEATSIATDKSISLDVRSVVLKRYDSLLSGNYKTTNTNDLLVGANTQWTEHQDATAQVSFNVNKLYLTPKIMYTFDETTMGTGVKTQDTLAITPSLLMRMDVALPRGLLLPGAKKAILFSNRIIWTTTLSVAHTRDPVVQANNTDLATLTTSGDYEIAKNLRLTLNGSLARDWDLYNPQNEYISYSLGTNLTFQF
jgi:hypothetical protein